MDITSKKVLCLNANWQAINVRTVKEAFVAMLGGDSNNPPVKALDINYPILENGEYDFDTQPSIVPVTWLEWESLPIREYDFVINTSKNKIRIPSVVVSVNYTKIPKKRFRPTKPTLYKMQGGKCGYSGDKISINQGNLEHVNPRSHGGKETFENLMFVKKELNSLRGNKPLHEFPFKPLFKNREPQPIPVNFTISPGDNIDWRWFIN